MMEGDPNGTITITPNKTAPQRCPFLQLPYEIRIQIYKYIFTPSERDRDGNITLRHDIIHIGFDWMNDLQYISHSIIPVSILRTSQCIYTEASLMLYGKGFILPDQVIENVSFEDMIGMKARYVRRVEMSIVGNEALRRGYLESIKRALGKLPEVRELGLTNRTSAWEQLIDWEEIIEIVKERESLRVLVNHADGQGIIGNLSCWKVLKHAGKRERASSFDMLREDAEMCPHKDSRHWHDGSSVYSVA